MTLIPYLSAAKELKTKPTQHSVKTLMESGVQADVLVCRTEHEISDSIRDKLARFCNVDTDCVIQSLDVKTIYDVPNHMLSAVSMTFGWRAAAIATANIVSGNWRWRNKSRIRQTPTRDPYS